MVNCPYCKHKMKKEKRAMNFKVDPEVIVTDVKTDVCNHCGFAAVPMNEAQTVYDKVHGFSKSKSTLIITKLHAK